MVLCYTISSLMRFFSHYIFLMLSFIYMTAQQNIYGNWLINSREIKKWDDTWLLDYKSDYCRVNIQKVILYVYMIIYLIIQSIHFLKADIFVFLYRKFAPTLIHNKNIHYYLPVSFP